MFGAETFDFPLWWILPLTMIALCYFMMRGRRGSMMCGFGSRNTDGSLIKDSDSAMEILDKRYALGEIDREEYEERKQALNHSS